MADNTKLISALSEDLQAFSKAHNVFLEGRIWLGENVVWFQRGPGEDGRDFGSGEVVAPKVEGKLGIADVKRLRPGTLLMFGTNPHTYKLLGVDKIDKGIRLNLLRDDGEETHATHHDLDVARVVNDPAPKPAAKAAPAPAKKATPAKGRK